MIQLAYVSSTEGLLDLDNIEDILTKSRTKNKGLGITGMLLYKGGNVLQILEGEEGEVVSLFEKICQDDRHKDVIRLYKKKIFERDFPDWNMGFSDLNLEGARHLEGFSEFLDPHFDLHQVRPSSAAKLLKLFKSNIR